jgi:hypothetical protein
MSRDSEVSGGRTSRQSTEWSQATRETSAGHDEAHLLGGDEAGDGHHVVVVDDRGRLVEADAPTVTGAGNVYTGDEYAGLGVPRRLAGQLLSIVKSCA